jgi:hypothetical protein
MVTFQVTTHPSAWGAKRGPDPVFVRASHRSPSAMSHQRLFWRSGVRCFSSRVGEYSAATGSDTGLAFVRIACATIAVQRFILLCFSHFLRVLMILLLNRCWEYHSRRGFGSTGHRSLHGIFRRADLCVIKQFLLTLSSCALHSSCRASDPPDELSLWQPAQVLPQ